MPVAYFLPFSDTKHELPFHSLWNCAEPQSVKIKAVMEAAPLGKTISTRPQGFDSHELVHSKTANNVEMLPNVLYLHSPQGGVSLHVT